MEGSSKGEALGWGAVRLQDLACQWDAIACCFLVGNMGIYYIGTIESYVPLFPSKNE